MAEYTATPMPDRGKSEIRCCEIAVYPTLDKELASFLPLEEKFVAQNVGDCRIQNPSKWVRVRPVAPSITLLRRTVSALFRVSAVTLPEFRCA
jgi:hypothetical protein